MMKKQQKPKSDSFSDFFLNTPEEEQLKILNEVVRKSNEDQLAIYKRYEEEQKKRESPDIEK